MKHALLASLLLAILPAAGATPLSFHEPAQFGDTAQASNEDWILVLFDRGSSAAGALMLESTATYTNESSWQPFDYDQEYFEWPVYFAHPGRSTWNLAPGRMDVDLGRQGPSALYVEGETLRLAAGSFTGDLHTYPKGSCALRLLEGEEDLQRTARCRRHDWDGVASRLDGSNGPTSFRLEGSGLRFIEWHNAQAACSSLSDEECPDGGMRRETVHRFGEGGNVTERLFSYDMIEPQGNSTLVIEGTAYAIMFGGPSIDLAIQGWVRMPLANAGPCGDCASPQGQTFQAEGDLNLTGLQMQQGDFVADFSGHVSSARFDETAIDPAALFGISAAATVAATVGLVLLAKALLGLFARSARPPALQHPKRRRVYELIRAEPGLSWSDLKRRSGWATGVLRFHLGRLVDEGLVARQRYRNTVRYFENHGRYNKNWHEVAPLRDPDVRRLHDWLLAKPAVDQTAIVRETRGWGWTRAKTRRRLHVLEEAKLVSSDAAGRCTRYTAKPAIVLPPALEDEPSLSLTKGATPRPQ